MRPIVMLLLCAAPALAGCGGTSREAASAPAAAPPATAPAARPESHVFTVPDELPPPERERRSRAERRPRPAPAAPVPSDVAGGAPTDAEVQRELAEALGVGGDRVADQAGLTAQGMATVPPGAPPQVAAIITAANQVARAPYRYGGGHGGVGGEETWVDSAYDCSGSVSFALASAGLLDRQLDSTSLMSWGRPGPGKWVTVFANAGHAFMVVAGLRFDTVERARTGTRWGRVYSKVSGFVARHPEGL